MPIHERYSQEHCNQCGTVTTREIRVVEDETGRITTDYCKTCKGFNRVETDASGRIVQQQYAI